MRRQYHTSRIKLSTQKTQMFKSLTSAGGQLTLPTMWLEHLIVSYSNSSIVSPSNLLLQILFTMPPTPLPHSSSIINEGSVWASSCAASRHTGTATWPIVNKPAAAALVHAGVLLSLAVMTIPEKYQQNLSNDESLSLSISLFFPSYHLSLTFLPTLPFVSP